MQITTVHFHEISETIDKRFSPKYFFMVYEMRELEKKPNVKVKKVEEISEYIISGSYIPKYFDKGTPYLRVGNIKAIELDLNQKDLVYIDKNKIKIPNKIMVDKNDLVIGRTAVLGISALINSISNGFIISQHLTRLKPQNIPSGYLVAFFNSSLFKKQMEIASYGVTRVELTHAQLKEIKVPIPQRQYLIKEINELIFLADKKHIEALNEINKAKKIFEEEINIYYSNIEEENTYSINSEDLTNILTPKFYYPKYLNTLKQLKKKFETVKLGNISNIKRGNEVGSENYKKYIDKKEIDIPFIRTSDIINFEIDNYPDYYIDKEIYDNLNQDINEGDIAYTKDGKIGLTAIITSEDKCILASGISRLRIKKYMSPYYVFLVLSTNIGLYQALQRTVIAATIPHLQSERLSEIEIPLIDSQKQKEISCLVEKAFKLKAEKKKLIRKAMNKMENFIR